MDDGGDSFRPAGQPPENVPAGPKDQPDRLQEDPEPERVDPLEQRVDQLEQRVDNLERPPDDGPYPIAPLVRTGKGHRIRNPGDRGEEITFLRRSGRIGPSGAGGIDGPGSPVST